MGLEIKREKERLPNFLGVEIVGIKRKEKEAR